MTNIFTAYCICKLCCGQHASGLDATGHAPREGITVAASRNIPLNTPISITISGVMTNRTFVVTDRLARRYDNRVDIYFSSHTRARQFGRQIGQYTIN